MKNLNVLALLAFLISSVGLTAQFDDLYYTDTSDDVATEVHYDDAAGYDDASLDDFDDAEYDSYGEYEYYSEYDNYYTSRIRRFSRPAGYNYYNSYYANDAFYDPFYSYYSPTYITFDRFGRRYINTANRRYRRGSFISFNFGFPGSIYNGFYNPYTNGGFGFANNAGLGGFGAPVGAAGRIGGYGCPVGGTRGVNVFNNRDRNSGVNANGNYRGARRSGSTRASTGYRSSNRARSYKTSVNEGKTPRTSSGARGSNTRPKTRSARPSTSTRSSNSSSRFKNNSSRRSSNFKSSGNKSFRSNSGSSRSFRSSGSSSRSSRGSSSSSRSSRRR